MYLVELDGIDLDQSELFTINMVVEALFIVQTILL